MKGFNVNLISTMSLLFTFTLDTALGPHHACAASVPPSCRLPAVQRLLHGASLRHCRWLDSTLHLHYHRYARLGRPAPLAVPKLRLRLDKAPLFRDPALPPNDSRGSSGFVSSTQFGPEIATGWPSWAVGRGAMACVLTQLCMYI